MGNLLVIQRESLKKATYTEMSNLTYITVIVIYLGGFDIDKDEDTCWFRLNILVMWLLLKKNTLIANGETHALDVVQFIYFRIKAF